MDKLSHQSRSSELRNDGSPMLGDDFITNEYDYENRIVKIEDSSSNDVAEYAYDALGRRIRVIDSKASTTTLYYYNPQWQVLAEYDGAGQLQRYYVYGNYIDEPLVMHRQNDDKDYYYAHDHLYSVVALIAYDDQAQPPAWDVVERYEYDAYGTVQIMDSSFVNRNSSLYKNPYTFTGRRLDTFDNGNLLTMHYRHRTYDTYTGRFCQHDPLGYVDGLGLYEYVGSIPLMYGDPTGRCMPDTCYTYKRCWIQDKGMGFELDGFLGSIPGQSFFPLFRYAEGIIETAERISVLIRNSLPSAKYLKVIKFRAEWNDHCNTTCAYCDCNRQYDSDSFRTEITDENKHGEWLESMDYILTPTGLLFARFPDVLAEVMDQFPPRDFFRWRKLTTGRCP